MALDDLFASLEISASGLRCQRARMDMIANNIANAQTTRTPDGGPYKRRDVVFAVKTDEAGNDAGVEVSDVVTDSSPARKVYEPGHPDADSDGYVSFPNVSTVTEMVNMVQVARAYEANVACHTAAKEMITRSLDILSK